MRSLIFLLFLFSSIVFAQVYKPDIRKGEIKIDGKLDEDDWKSANVYSGFNLLKSIGGGKPKADTSFRILTDENAIYIGIRCEEPYIDKLKDDFLPRDSSFWERDSVEVFIDPEGRGFNYYQFAVTSSNSQFDSYWIEGGNTQGGYYSGLWESATYKGENFWSCEVKIPLYCFFNTPSKDFSSTWLVNITRNRFPEHELSTWAVCERSFHEVKNFRKFTDMPLKNPVYDIRLGKTEVEIKDEKLKGDLIVKIDVGKKATGLREIKVCEKEREIGSKTVNLKEGENLIKIEDIEFGKEGKREIGIIVLNGNEKVSGFIQEVNITYEKLSVEIKKPFYSRCIYPGQKIKDIEGKVYLNMPEEKIKNSKLTIELKGDDFSREIDLKPENIVEFKVKADDLKEGDYNLIVELKGVEGTIDKKEVKIRKIKKPEKGSYVYIDEDLNLVVNGKPIFVRGWCGNSVYMVSQAIRNKYGNKPNSEYVNTWECWIGVEAERLSEAYQELKEDMDKMGISKEEFLKVASEERNRIKQDVKPHILVYKYIEKRIEKAKEDPNLWFYYLCDEPECRGVSPVYLKYMYNFIKEKDPYHPVMIITREPKKYTNCADILNPHPYLNPIVDDSGKRKMRSIKTIKNVIKEVYEAGKYKIPAWCTPQAFSYGFVDRFADYPTFDEFNSMVWTSIVNGAKGLTPFIYSDHFNSIDLRLGVDFIYQTISNLEEFLLTHPENRLRFENKNKDIDILIKEKDGKILLVAVNMTENNQEDEIYSEGLKKIKKLYGFRENTFFDVKDGKIKLGFYPYQVHILTYPQLDKGLKKVEELKDEINKFKEECKSSGNILYGKGRDIEWVSSDSYIGNMFLYTLTDGIKDSFGVGYGAQVPFTLEGKFLTFVPEFKRLKIY
ncbi:MAG: sugar-binding protein, partial [Candidatus Ratteibacteria bacterium]